MIRQIETDTLLSTVQVVRVAQVMLNFNLVRTPRLATTAQVAAVAAVTRLNRGYLDNDGAGGTGGRAGTRETSGSATGAGRNYHSQ